MQGVTNQNSHNKKQEADNITDNVTDNISNNISNNISDNISNNMSDNISYNTSDNISNNTNISNSAYTAADFAGGVPMNEPVADRSCKPAAEAYSDGVVTGYLDNPCIPPESDTPLDGHSYASRLMEHRKLEIKKVIGREILDSRGNPTVEAQVLLADGTVGHGMVPSGASTGAFEAVELRDIDSKRYRGKGTQKAVNHINVELNNTVLAMDASDMYAIDYAMIKEDGTKDKSRLGANSILAVSIACARAAAASLHMPLYKYIGGSAATTLPVPMMNIINGGRHAVGSDFQEYMIVPAGACCFKEALRMGTEVFHSLKTILQKKGYAVTVGDEGGFAPDVADAFEVFELLMDAVRTAGYEPGKDIYFAMDAAASELYNIESGLYEFPREYAAMCKRSGNNNNLALKQTTLTLEAPTETHNIHKENVDINKQNVDKNNENVLLNTPDTINTTSDIKRDSTQLVDYYSKIIDKFPVISIEDPLNEEDWEGWKVITDRLGKRVQLVGDDLFVTNTERLRKGIESGCANSVLIKFNQIGTLSETIKAVRMAQQAGYIVISSHRSGETEDTTIADMAVALNMGQIKAGAPSRGERVAKYNRLLRIEDELGQAAVFPGIEAFKAGLYK